MGQGSRLASGDFILSCGELPWHSTDSEPCCVQRSHSLTRECPVT